jgi:methyl-accepting chemotaxis protein
VAEQAEHSIKQATEHLAAFIHALQEKGRLLAEGAAGENIQASSVATGCGEATRSVGAIVEVLEMFSGAADKTGQQVTRAAQLSQEAEEVALRAAQAVDTLLASAGRIDEVSRRIAPLSSRIGLLALNAAIEASRTGGSGSGAAAVAEEVKRVSEQTGKITAALNQAIGEARSEIGKTAHAVRTMTLMLQTMADIAEEVASSLRQHGEISQEIFRSMQHISTDTEGVTRTAEALSAASLNTSRTAEELQQAFDGLAAHAGSLNTEVTTFIRQLRAA